MSVSINGTTGLVFNDGSTQPTAASGFGFKNRIINGDMRIDQRNAGASVTGGVGYTFPVDRFKFYSAAASKLSGQRSTTAPAGFTNSLLITSLASTTPAAGDEYQLYHNIEGFNVADLGWGTASAQTVTLSFWVRSSLTGTFAGCLFNDGGSRSYIFTYAIAAANTWEQKTITVAGDTSGTWATGNAAGLSIIWDLGSGSNLNGTAGAWASAFDTRTSGSVSVVGTNGATFQATGVQLEKGSTATSFDYRPYGTELALCQRYYYKLVGAGTSSPLSIGFVESSTTAICATFFPVELRVKPTALEQTGTASNYRVRYGGGGATACSSVPSFWEATKTSAATLFTVASGLTSGQAAFGANNIADTPYLAWSAEL
jgi:hypothetical protein